MPDGIIKPSSRTLHTVSDLITAGLAPEPARLGLEAVAQRYAIAVTPAVLSLIEQPDDSIGRQFIPNPLELVTAPHESADPIADEVFSPVKGIVHRYPDRALLKPTLTCPVYCRFCFRREQVGPDGGLLTETELNTAYAWIAGHPAIREIILTGGDPLILSPRRLARILTALAAIPHLESIRIHSRVPVADPERITTALADALDIETPLFLVLHTNHAREFSESAILALRRLQKRGIPILGQSVLLAGVNDSETALADLFRMMIRARVKPYYLHQLDPAPGTARFHVPIARGRVLISALRGRISGIALPTYIFDQPGGAGKVPLEPSLVPS